MNRPQLKRHEMVDGERVELVQKYTENSDCPECGAKGPHESNLADRLSQLTYLCTECGMQFDAVS